MAGEVDRFIPCPTTQPHIPLHQNFVTVSPVPLFGNRKTPDAYRQTISRRRPNCRSWLWQKPCSARGGPQTTRRATIYFELFIPGE